MSSADRAVAVVLAGMVTTACYRRPDTLGQPCQRARDCDGEQVCAQGRCATVADDPVDDLPETATTGATDTESTDGTGSSTGG